MSLINYKINKYKLKYYLNPKKIYIKKLKYYMKGGGFNVFNNFTLALINKHKVLFPESEQDYDKYFDPSNQNNSDEELIKLIEKYEYRIIDIPQIIILQMNTKLYHLTPYKLESNKGYPNNYENYFTDSLENIYNSILPFKRDEGYTKELYLYEYEIKEDIILIYTNFNYNIFNLESFFENIDKKYKREFNIKGDGNNGNISKWLSENIYILKEQNGGIEYKGWYEEPSALPVGTINEIMLLGDTSKLLKFNKCEIISE